MQEKELIKNLKNSKSRNGAFAELLSQYQERVYWHIRKIVVVHEDADDVVQNTFIKVFRNIDSFKGDSKLYTWIFRIATNESITFLNKRKRKRSESLDSEEAINLTSQIVADPFFSDDTVSRNLAVAVGQLPEKQRLVFQMKYFDNMSYKDISEILGTSEGGLKASYHHASQKIMEHLKKVEFF